MTTYLQHQFEHKTFSTLLQLTPLMMSPLPS